MDQPPVDQTVELELCAEALRKRMGHKGPHLQMPAKNVDKGQSCMSLPCQKQSHWLCSIQKGLNIFVSINDILLSDHDDQAQDWDA